MSKSHFPSANITAQYWAGKFAGSTMNTNCACIHTTETSVWPGYGGGGSAPHMTILPDIAKRSVTFRQHFPAGKSSRALVNLSGGVQTNTLNVFQIELIGTCDPKYRVSRKEWGKAGVDYIYWPDAPDWLIKAIAPVFTWLDDEWPNFKIADATPRGWAKYPDSYGINARQRMTAKEWAGAFGIFGHQHVPENTHGDPGNFPIARLVAAATNGVTTPATPPPAPKPTPAPTKHKTVRHFEHRHLNTWGDDGGKGTASFYDRINDMAKDLVSGINPEVITLNEVKADQVPSWVKRLKAEGYDVVLAEAGNLVAVPAGTEVRKAQTKYLPAKIQGEGRREALGMVRAKINGHWEHIFASHLDYRDGAKFDAIRLRQAKWIASEAKRWSVTFALKSWLTHTTIGIDENSTGWVRDRAFRTAGFKTAIKSGIDAIYGNRDTQSTRTIATASDHPIVAAVYAKKI